MPPRAGAGGPSSQARQSEGPKRRPGPRPGLYRGLQGRGAGAGGADGGGRRPCALSSLAFSESSRPGGAGGWGARGPKAKGQAGGCEDALRAPRARGWGGALPLPARPLGSGRPLPRLDPREHVCSGAGRGRGRWGRGRALPSRSFCATWKVRMCSEDTSAERRGGRGRDIHTVWPLGRPRRACSLSPGLEGAAGRARCAD